MRFRRGTIVVAAMAGLAAALATSAAAEAPIGPDPVVYRWASWPYQTSCEEGIPFDPVAVFSGATEAELGSTPAEQALRAFLGSGEFSELRHRRHWRLIAEDERRAEFVQGRLSGRLEWLLFERTKGGWHFVGYSSGCKPTDVFSQGPVVTWSLDRGNGRLGRGTKSVKVDLDGGPCNSGMSENKHAHAVFRAMGRKLLMTIWLDPLPPGGNTCVGLIEPPLVVELPGRLGNRTLYDGSTYPPLRAAQTRNRE